MKEVYDMMELVSGLFTDKQQAAAAITELKQKGFVHDISVIAKDADKLHASHSLAHTARKDRELANGTTTGAVTGGAIGAATGLLASAVSLLFPDVGLLTVTGPLAATWGVTGGALGAVAGGIVGALIDAGISEEKANLYAKRIETGDTLVTVETDQRHSDQVRSILDRHRVQQSRVVIIPQ